VGVKSRTPRVASESPRCAPAHVDKFVARRETSGTLRVMPAAVRVQSDRRSGEVRALVCAFAGSG
jgi:hypothetical protein